MSSKLLSATEMCSICNKVFSNKYNLQRHKQSKHESPVNARTSESPSMLLYVKVICPLCNVELSNRYTLKRHISLKHRDDKIEQNVDCSDEQIHYNLNETTYASHVLDTADFAIEQMQCNSSDTTNASNAL